MEASPETRPASDRPATAADLRGLRRWLIAVSILALAATAVAVLALVDARNHHEKGVSAADVAASTHRVEERLDRRLSSLERQLGGLATSADLKRLDARVRRVESRSRSAATDAKDASDKATSLERRVSKLEQSGGSSGTSGKSGTSSSRGTTGNRNPASSGTSSGQ